MSTGELTDSEVEAFEVTAALFPHSAYVVLDRDLRVEMAAGELFEDAGRDPRAARGRPFGEVLATLEGVEGWFRAGASGTPADFSCTTRVGRRELRVRVRPRRSAGGEVVGVVALLEDVAASAERAVRLARSRATVGHAWFVRETGWTFDEDMRELWGLTPDGADPWGDLETAVVPAEREQAVLAWRRVLREGGESSGPVRIRDRRTGSTRLLDGHWQAEVDAAGHLLRAVVSHRDRGAVAHPERDPTLPSPARRAAAGERTELLGHMSQVLASSGSSTRSSLQRVADFAARAIGSHAALYLLDPDPADGPRVLMRFFACPRPEDLPAWREAVTRHEEDWEAGPLGTVHRTGRALSTVGRPEGVAAFAEQYGESRYGPDTQMVLASGRYQGTGLALLLVSRVGDGHDLGPVDADLVQVLADRVALGLAAERATAAADRADLERSLIATRVTHLMHEQSDLLEQLARTESRERALLAEAVHDEPLQLIVSAMMRLEYASSGPGGATPEAVDEVLASLERSVGSLRTLIVALTPPDLSDGLGPALMRLAEGIFIGTPTTVELRGPVHVSLTPEVKTAAYRILRESLVNTRKHARARAVVITLREDAHRVVLSTGDDGVGSERLDTDPGHLGIATMHARAEAAGGELQVESHVGRGTRVTLTLPVRPGGPHDETREQTRTARPMEEMT